MSTAVTPANPTPPTIIEKKPGVRHILDNSKYPEYIRNHAVFNKFDKIIKVFPNIGLPNTSEECMYSNALEAQQDGQNLLYTDVRNALYAALGHAGGTGHDTVRAILSAMYSTVGGYYPQMLVLEEGKLSIKLMQDVALVDGKPFAKKGEGFFKAYNKLIEKCKEAKPPIPLAALESMPFFKTFSATNVPGGRIFKIVFSASGSEGAWDIATISMRGISSCQSWGSSQSRGLIGSISSKYVGVAYITSGDPFNEYGSKMIRRSMVRFCIDKTTKKPGLLLDRIYPNDDQAARTLFREFLKKKTNLPVLFPGDTGWANYYLPCDTYWKATPLQTNEFTYMDNKIAWKNPTPTPKDTAPYYQRIAHIDNELAIAVHTVISKMLDEYCTDKKVHTDIFKGGVANLLLSMRKNLGAHVGFMGHFLPKLYNVVTTTQLLPKAETFQGTPKEYEKLIIKSVFKQMKVFDGQTKDNCTKMGKFMKFYPKSAPKLITLVLIEYKKALVKRYKNLLQD
jgi:hypothetical protein